MCQLGGEKAPPRSYFLHEFCALGRKKKLAAGEKGNGCGTHWRGVASEPFHASARAPEFRPRSSLALRSVQPAPLVPQSSPVQCDSGAHHPCKERSTDHQHSRSKPQSLPANASVRNCEARCMIWSHALWMHAEQLHLCPSVLRILRALAAFLVLIARCPGAVFARHAAIHRGPPRGL